MIKRFKILRSDYQKYARLFENMTFRADDYVPDRDDMYNVILQNPQEYITFLMWIIQTGYDTEDNAKTRNWICNLLDEILEIAEG